MIWYSAVTLVLLSVQTLAFPRGKITEKPQLSNPITSKHRKAPTHISEFTDPDTGLNPFLDIEEGQTSLGRNTMEDEIRDDTPYFDMDLVEGDASNRRWGLPDPKESFDKAPTIGRWPVVDYKDDSFDFPVATTPVIFPSSTTTTETTATEEQRRTETNEDHTPNRGLKIEENDQRESIWAPKSSVIYAAASIVAFATVVLLIGACWWRRKLKASHSATRAENNNAKS